MKKDSRKNNNNKQSNGHARRPRLHFCPKCLGYFFKDARRCPECMYRHVYTSVLYKRPETISDIPREDWVRIIKDRKQNGFYTPKLEDYYRKAKSANRPIPSDFHPVYGNRKPKAQRGNFSGIANHYGVGGHVNPEYNLKNYIEILKNHNIKSIEEIKAESLDAGTALAALMCIVRQERFCDGLILSCLKNGKIQSLLIRLKNIDGSNA